MRPIYALTAFVTVLLSVLTQAGPSVFPTGTTIYDPARAWSGFTVLSPLQTQAAVVIDMNGKVVKQWDGLNNSAGGPSRVLPNGDVIAAAGARPGRQESLELVQRDFAGNVVWRLDRNEEIPTSDGKTQQSLRQHHDWQREDFPAGYYSPDFTPARSGSNTLVLTHTDRRVPGIADVLLQDDRIIEVSPKGEIVWQWSAGDHIDELGFDARARESIRGARAGGAAGRAGAGRGAPAPADGAGRLGAGRGAGAAPAAFDWLHLNSATYLGPNRWFDAGDKRFAPNNVIVSSREASLLAIIARDGSIVWRLGPNFLESDATRAIGQIIGQHHAHFIPKGLPGAGHLLVFDNGGSSGYGEPSGIAPRGTGVYARATSRVLEIDPVTLALVWSYTAGAQFFSTNISGAQRLPNGNTLITEGAGGRVFEVTSDRQIVWEFMNAPANTTTRTPATIYRAYRVPYTWLSQLPRPQEKAVTPPPNGEFRVP
ncbi:MAG: aryl-sulfate sulfotransferase [Vicinamibacterales bacterium]